MVKLNTIESGLSDPTTQRRTAMLLEQAVLNGNLGMFELTDATNRTLPQLLEKAAETAANAGKPATFSRIMRTLDAMKRTNLAIAIAYDKSARLEAGDPTEITKQLTPEEDAFLADLIRRQTRPATSELADETDDEGDPI